RPIAPRPLRSAKERSICMSFVRRLPWLGAAVLGEGLGRRRDAGGAAEGGRWKVQGDGGWGGGREDSGPRARDWKAGRGKLDGERCYFDAHDSGPNQCVPSEE